ncbi:hypothetical protein WKY82_10870 [Gordonia malaquae]|jgi:Na+/proline symporter|uniref:hypothetical protein n=1 Tax=Gordonia TaxID=2053 RepID=UPI0030C78B26
MTENNTLEAESAERRRSPGLAVLGILALMVAGWGLLGGPSLGDTRALPWAVLAVGVVIGLGLVASGMRRR